jgi:hypothetical protein
MKLTDPEVIEHIKQNYYIQRESWNDKGIGIYHDTKVFWFSCPPIERRYGFTLSDLEADDWILCPKE